MKDWFVIKADSPRWRGWWFAGKISNPHVSDWFPTWREAMDYALAQARLDRQEQCS